jgi:hypothetical protein
MRIKSFIVWLPAVFAAMSAWSQIVRIEFSSQVTQVVGSPLEDVTVGSIITGHVEVDLARLPIDHDPWPGVGGYAYLGDQSGFTLQFDTGFQTITYNSINAARDGGTAPGIFLYDEAGNHDHLGLQARDQGNPYAAILSFEDITVPRTLASGDFFPESLNLRAGMGRAMFQYFDNFGTDSVVAQVTSASMTVDSAETLVPLLMLRVKASNLSMARKRMLLTTLRSAEHALDQDRCKAALRYLRTFQIKVRSQVKKIDSELARRLISGAQSVINSGCGQ